LAGNVILEKDGGALVVTGTATEWREPQLNGGNCN
jgi:hypothetical protein